eukprot:SAG11_NODE_27681_length_330_cov_0.857143_1_plen_36_part_10
MGAAGSEWADETAAGVHSLRHLAQMDATALDTLLAT